MHPEVRQFFEYARNRYRNFFDGPNAIAEFGSYNINGTVREYFTGCSQYTGVDWRMGPGVDLVCEAKNVPFEAESFDVVVSTSHLEHDAEWALSLDAMVRCLKRSGILLLSWGGAYCCRHQMGTAIDGRFHRLPGAHVLQHLALRGVYVHELFYDRDIPARRPTRRRLKHPRIGSINLVGFRDRAVATTDSQILPLEPADQTP